MSSIRIRRHYHTDKPCPALGAGLRPAARPTARLTTGPRFRWASKTFGRLFVKPIENLHGLTWERTFSTLSLRALLSLFPSDESLGLLAEDLQVDLSTPVTRRLLFEKVDGLFEPLIGLSAFAEPLLGQCQEQPFIAPFLRLSPLDGLFEAGDGFLELASAVSSRSQ